MAGAIETTRQNVAALSVTSPVGAEVMRAVQGDYRGETVETSSEASKLEDAKEEIGMSVAHRADRRSLGQRQIRQGQGANLEALARIADYYDKLPDMPRESELQSLVEDLTRMQELLAGGGGGGEAAKDELFALLERFDSDPAHQFAGLSIARDFFAAAGASPEFRELLDLAHAEYERGDLGRDVRAGFAAAEIASREAATLETDPRTVRDTYRQMLRETPDMGRLFEQFRAFDPLKKLDEIVSIFMTVAGRDLASAGPSADPMHLHGLLTELAKLKKLTTVMEMADQLVRTVARLALPGESARGTATDLAGQILGYASRLSAGLPDARALIAAYADASSGTRLAFANGLRVLHGELSDEVMPSPQARLQQVSALVMLQDELVAEEEAEYSAAANRAGAGA